MKETVATIKYVIDKVYEAYLDDPMEVSMYMGSKEMNDVFKRMFIKIGVDVEWMDKPFYKDYNGKGNLTAKTYALRHPDDIETEIKELYEKYGDKFHPYMFSRVEVVDGAIPDALSDEEIAKLPKKSIYSLRFGLEELTDEEVLDEFKKTTESTVDMLNNLDSTLDIIKDNPLVDEEKQLKQIAILKRINETLKDFNTNASNMVNDIKNKD
jgi:hypothetical protein